jgi:hypothetical protein
VLHCEGRDDLELVTPERRCLISVKTQSVKLSLVIEEYARLSKRRYTDPFRKSVSALILVGSQEAQITRLAIRLEEAQSLLVNREVSEAEEIRAEFHKRWPQISDAMVDGYFIETNLPSLHSREYMAIASQTLRNIAPLTDYTDDRTALILHDLNEKMSRARMARGSVTLTEVRDTIFGFALPLEMVTLPHAYVKTKYGYLKHRDISEMLEQEARDLSSALRSAMRRYRRATRKMRISAILAGPVRCIACNGPLMANMYGFTRRGIACSHCGFSPYMSLFYACTCARPMLLLSQPSVDLVDAAISIRRALETVRCEHCGQRPKPERLQTRVFQLNIPWPPEDFSDKQLTQAREDFGWSKARFRDGDIDARDALLTEALTDRIESRLPGA